MPCVRDRWSGAAGGLVIGGTLFIGRALVERLLERGDEVVVPHRGRLNPFEDRAGEIVCDRNDVGGIAAAIAGSPRTAPQALRLQVERGGLLRGARSRRGRPSRASRLCPDAYCRNKAESERLLFRLGDEVGLPATALTSDD